MTLQHLKVCKVHLGIGNRRCLKAYPQNFLSATPGRSIPKQSFPEKPFSETEETISERWDHYFLIVRQVASTCVNCQYNMACTLYPDAPGMQSMPQLWRSLHRHWSKPSHEPDQEWNDDLAGSFNAVLCQDIVRAVIALTEQFFEHSGCTVLSVDLLSKSGHQRQPRGRTRSSFKRCWVEDIPLIVQVSFSTGIFTAAGKCRLQKEGTCIGNQISPVLSGLPVLMAEQIFLKSLPHAVFSSLLFLRYVDNRLILAPSRIFQNPQIRDFCRPDCYKGIQLESVEDHQWLGFTIDASARTATFSLPKKSWQIRSPASAGSWRLAASGFFSRAAPPQGQHTRQWCLS